MITIASAARHLKLVEDRKPFDDTIDLDKIRKILEEDAQRPHEHTSRHPFSLTDATFGVENELQTVVQGKPDMVDLPLWIANSNYYKNIAKRSATGDAPLKALVDLEVYLQGTEDRIWENSWVSFPKRTLSSYANHVLDGDLLADKSVPYSPLRSDADRFFHVRNGEPHLRIPVSYLLKIALADAVSPDRTHKSITPMGERLMKHFLNDNTSPETYSFYPVSSGPAISGGKGVARETLKRFFLTQLLVLYANTRFRLMENGQRVTVYFSPHTPVRQKGLNDIIPDAFYRELFMSPCLSGWNRGEDKYRYMFLCHQVLSRSQLNAVVKLKEAGIITRNLVVLPNTSNTSLTNNGTHISIGSRTLTRLLADPHSGFTVLDEKYLGDLGVKIMEHFLPLFVGTYSAAPYRLDFKDFHPEKVLGFLPHELDFTHIRMIWRRWKKKADLKFMGQPLTPFGPEFMDRFLSRVLGLKGDFVTDFRLMDYLVCLMSTDESPALNGKPGNEVMLKKDLGDQGVFDPTMALYLFCRQRQFQTMGFSGFENRLYSQFHGIQKDMAYAADLQQLITAFAFKTMVSGNTTHRHIPDDPFIESERRQIIFGAALGIPTFYVKSNTGNLFLKGILQRTQKARSSRRYQGYLRVQYGDYIKALVMFLKDAAMDLIETMHMKEMVADLENRIRDPEATAGARLTKEILKSTKGAHPLDVPGNEFNLLAENYYRNGLRSEHLEEAFDILEKDFNALDAWQSWREGTYNQPLLAILEGKRPGDFLRTVKGEIVAETLSETNIRKLIHLTLLTIDRDMHNEKKSRRED